MKTKIVASLMPTHSSLTESELQHVTRYVDDFDILELRIDALTHCEIATVRQIVQQLIECSTAFELLVTYRTSDQGGQGRLSQDDYLQLLRDLATLEHIDMIDIEWAQYQDNRRQIVEAIHQGGKISIASYHNFNETPQIEVLKKTYYHMAQLGANHLKIAVMPHSQQDVLTLLQALTEASEALPQWVTGIAMGQLGRISRTAQNAFGGALSYGALFDNVAPGQLHVHTLAEVLPLYSIFES
ncbi:type I 3-dehydroquinate dehydratase [Staphylococcus lutrae]|uniref:3-dehydroquinate dehydratase n=1 Tax=Staphylococcus lutrae TaxID=155085 RepID=A0AAC9RP69_9STAP|nr:type I 3-dehydroquinate dehydratase [Staphylococcus lutrae]ARJ51338.1 type I 3-dehydroquinate dehydratase [Staphylococcus lutrae]PNZ35848.1 type I 3-dehydroquinate dehydratase [Staphylococcus lutrae]